MLADHILIVDRLARDQLLELGVIELPFVFVKAGSECAAVVEAEIAFVIRIFGENDSFFSQDFLKQLEVDRLVVDDNAVEVENNRSQHD